MDSGEGLEKQAAAYIQEVLKERGAGAFPPLVLVLGSGLGDIADEMEGAVYIDYGDIPGFAASTVPGHRGRFAIGRLNKRPAAIMQGRLHYYEGYSMQQIAFPVRVLKQLGVKDLLLTNAAGGINRSFSPGDLMLIRDHVKLSLDSPLRGPNDEEYGPRFNDMSNAYTKELRSLAKDAAAEVNITLQEGVYAYMGGPSFETPAEIEMLRVLGADAVGMSTAPEVITAAHAGIRVLALSTITNMAAGILDQPLDHEEVLEMGQKVKGKLSSLIVKVVALMKEKNKKIL